MCFDGFVFLKDDTKAGIPNQESKVGLFMSYENNFRSCSLVLEQMIAWFLMFTDADGNGKLLAGKVWELKPFS